MTQGEVSYILRNPVHLWIETVFRIGSDEHRNKDEAKHAVISIIKSYS
jgi:hypothetical protein